MIPKLFVQVKYEQKPLDQKAV